MNATKTWRSLLTDILDHGKLVEQNSAGAAFRGRTSYEIIGNQTVWAMSNPVVLCPGRKPGFRFMAAEAAFILSGSNRLADIKPYAKNIAKFSDDGNFLAGAYGPPFRDQIAYIVQTIKQDRFSRQAIATYWRPCPLPSRDIPCTISLQHLIRDEAGIQTLHTIATMRSNDAMFGTIYDVHAFSAISTYIVLLLRDHIGPLALGLLYLTVGSQHIYHVDREAAAACAARDDELCVLTPLDLADFSGPDDLTEHLWTIARRTGVLHGRWLTELEEAK